MSRQDFFSARANTDTHLKITEIFETVDGETSAYPQGGWSTFIRLQGCRIGCTWCFGVKPGKRVPRVTLAKPRKAKTLLAHANTTKERIDKVQVGDVLLTLDDDHNLVETTVTEIHSRKAIEWYEIEIDSGFSQKKGGDSVHYFVTPEHPFSTVRGWVEAKDLIPGDIIFQVEANEIISHFKKGSRNPNYKQETYRPNYEALKKRLALVHRPCEDCATVTKLEVHHRDGDHDNDNPKNLAAICHKCHSNYHKRGYNFWNGRRRDGKVSSTCAEINHNGAEVIKTTRVYRDPKITWRGSQGMRDDLEVFNLTCAPYNTYLLDRMWVHNCDTKYTWDPRGGRLMTPAEIMRCLSFSFVRKVTITGGEPMEQYGWAFRELLDLLAARHFEVSMETGGCDDLRHVIQSHGEVNFVVDYKMPAAKIVRPLVMPNFERLRCSDIVKFVVRLEEMETLPSLVKNLREKHKCSARMVFSPVWEQADVLPKFMVAARAFGFARLDIGLNLQLHKFLFPTVRDEEVSLIHAPR